MDTLQFTEYPGTTMLGRFREYPLWVDTTSARTLPTTTRAIVQTSLMFETHSAQVSDSFLLSLQSQDIAGYAVTCNGSKYKATIRSLPFISNTYNFVSVELVPSQ